MNSPAFERVAAWDNLLMAFRRAARGKRGARSAAAFEYRVADRLLTLHDELVHGRYQPGPYVHFHIHEPKLRKISASPFRDRVVHHALCQVIEPRFEHLFIADSYANRVGKGTHRAVDRLQTFSQKYRYVLRADVVQHFAALDHAVLRATLAKVIPEHDVMHLVNIIITSGIGVLDDTYTMKWYPGDDPEGVTERLIEGLPGSAGILPAGSRRSQDLPPARAASAPKRNERSVTPSGR